MAVGDLTVCATSLLGVAPSSVFEHVTSMRYADAIYMMKPTSTWDGIGLAFYQLMCTLIICAWTASEFNAAEQFHNCLVGYYMFLHSMSQARRRHGRQYETECLALITMRNTLCCAGHALQRQGMFFSRFSGPCAMVSQGKSGRACVLHLVSSFLLSDV